VQTRAYVQRSERLCLTWAGEAGEYWARRVLCGP